MNTCYISSSDLYHHGILGMKWGVRRYQNADGSLTAAGKSRYHVQEGKHGKTEIVDRYGTKMKGRDRRYIEKQMKADLKAKGGDEYKEYKNAKRQANVHRTYNGYETTASKVISNKGKAKVNQMLADYANSYLDSLAPQKKTGKAAMREVLKSTDDPQVRELARKRMNE